LPATKIHVTVRRRECRATVGLGSLEIGIFTDSYKRSSEGRMGIAAEKREKLKQLFEGHGLSITEWAEAHGFRREQVYAVLNGRATGRRGASHRIAIALGLKTVPAEALEVKPQDRPTDQPDERSADELKK
jgi:gp16 family phage-associated protein